MILDITYSVYKVLNYEANTTNTTSRIHNIFTAFTTGFVLILTFAAVFYTTDYIKIHPNAKELNLTQSRLTWLMTVVLGVTKVLTFVRNYIGTNVNNYFLITIDNIVSFGVQLIILIFCWRFVTIPRFRLA